MSVMVGLLSQTNQSHRGSSHAARSSKTPTTSPTGPGPDRRAAPFGLPVPVAVAADDSDAAVLVDKLEVVLLGKGAGAFPLVNEPLPLPDGTGMSGGHCVG
jgi:hypothetical protein